MATIIFDTPVTRIVDEEVPIMFDWPRTGVYPQLYVAFNNVDFVPIAGTVEEISPYKYRISYNEADRPIKPALISYKIVEGGDEGTFELVLIASTKPLRPAPSPRPSLGSSETPVYKEGDTAYLRESAALGFLEAVTISGLVRQNGNWLYSVKFGGMSRSVALYGDRISLVNSKMVYFSQNELISLCDALALAEANARRVLERLQAQYISVCPQIDD